MKFIDFGIKKLVKMYMNYEKTNVISIGVDIVEVQRITDALKKWGGRFMDRVWTSDEIDYCVSTYNPDEHFAARFAAKEAVSKSLGNTWDKGIRWKDINIVRGPSGIPEVKLSGEPRQKADELYVKNIMLSMSHCSDYAVAYVVVTN